MDRDIVLVTANECQLEDCEFCPQMNRILTTVATTTAERVVKWLNPKHKGPAVRVDHVSAEEFNQSSTDLPALLVDGETILSGHWTEKQVRQRLHETLEKGVSSAVT